MMADAQAGGAMPARRPAPLGERLRAWRTRLVADPRFRRLASSLPFVRGVARREAAAVFDLCAGFVYSQILLACVRLRVFDLLADGARTTEDMARAMDLEPAAAERLLAGAASLGLLARCGDGAYALDMRGAVVRADPGIRAMIEHHALVYRDLADPVALLRGQGGTQLAAYWSYARADRPSELDDGAVAAYSRLMSASQPLVADQILDSYAFGAHRCVLDVGGGEGGFLVAAGARHPDLQLVLFDLPAVVARAQTNFAAAGLGARARVGAGDFRRDVLPQGADLATLVRVLHDHDDDAALAILRAIRSALAPGGTVLIGEPMADAADARTVGAAYFGFYLMAMGQGRARTPAEIFDLLARAGFRDARVRPTAMPLQTGVITAVTSRL
jgi:demethylspheroidene O-methyltransferase